MLTTDNIQYASTYEIIAEIERLKKDNTPTTIVEVLNHILLERKENIEKTLTLYENAIKKSFQYSFTYSIFKNYKESKEELEAINKFLG